MKRLFIPDARIDSFFQRAKSEVLAHPVMAPIAQISIEENRFVVEFRFLGYSRVEYSIRETAGGILAERHNESIAITHKIFQNQFEDTIFSRIRDLGAYEID